MMRYLNLLLLICIAITGCDGVITPINPSTTSTLPMWPQMGYDGRQSGNPFSPQVYIQPVNNGVVNWTYNVSSGALSDGSEFCIDSKGFVYYQDDRYNGSLYKFSPTGEIIWKKDSLTCFNYDGISLSEDETKIYLYIHSNSEFCCYDSSGNKMWSIFASYGFKPIIGEDGTIYTYLEKFSAINPDGTIKWTCPHTNMIFGRCFNSMDKEGNIYLSGEKIIKLNKNGAMLWTYTFPSPGFTQAVLIDGYNNLYFIEYNSRSLYSLDKDGNLRWKLTDNYKSIPAIGKKNIIYSASNDSIKAHNISGEMIWSTPALESKHALPDYILLDGEENLYYILDGSELYATSLTKDGVRRWVFGANIGSVLPAPVLSPLGQFIFTPKRAFIIHSLK
jgi:hypothetical protein